MVRMFSARLTMLPSGSLKQLRVILAENLWPSGSANAPSFKRVTGPSFAGGLIFIQVGGLLGASLFIRMGGEEDVAGSIR